MTAQPSPDAGASVPAGTAVQVETVTSDTISSENKVSGKVTSDLDASVFVATSAKCTAVYVEVGDTVRAGQALCTLDLASTLSSYEAANIGYTSAVQSYQDQAALFDKQIALYEKNVNDLKALQEIGAASQSEIDAAELTLMSAQVTRDSTLSQLEAGIQSAKASVEQLATALENVDARGNVCPYLRRTAVPVRREGRLCLQRHARGPSSTGWTSSRLPSPSPRRWCPSSPSATAWM